MGIQRGLACFAAAVLLGLGMPAFAQTGHQLFLGPAYEGPPPAAVPFAPAEFDIDTGRLALTVYLNRAPDAGTEHPTAISFDVVWNPSVLTIPSPAAVTPVPLLNDWYGKQTTVGFDEVEDGVLVISIAGGVTFPPNSFDTLSTEITTFDNQLPEIAPEQGAPQQNSFPLATIEFVIASPPGNSTAIGLDAVAMSDQNAQALPTQGAIGTSATTSSPAFPPMLPGAPAATPSGLAVLALCLLALALRRQRA